MQPNLALRYNSGSGRSDDDFGFGWTINIPYIQRLNKKGVENLYTASSTPYFTSSEDGELATTTAGNSTSYGARYDSGSFRQYTYSTTTGWTVTDKGGVTYKYGTTTNARLDNGSNTFRWMLEEVRDPNGNWMYYKYAKDQNQIYPYKITYTHATTSGIFEIEFIRDNPGTWRTSYETGFAVSTAYRVSEIQVKINGAWVTDYTLAYTTADNGYRQLLSSITEAGKVEGGTTTTLPATSFDYQSFDKFTSAQTAWTQDTGWAMPDYFTTGTDDLGRRYGEINGDGLVDFFSYNNLAPAGDREVLLNASNGSGGGWANTSMKPPLNVPFADGARDSGVRQFDANGDGLIDIIQGLASSTKVVYINNGDNTGWTASSSWVWPISFASGDGLGDYGVNFGDVNGDGLIDMVQSRSGSTTGQRVYINNGDGTGWTYRAGYNTFPSYYFTDGTKDLNARLEDINGDGLADFIKGSDYVYLNKGDGTGWVQSTAWGTTPVDFVNASGSDLGARLVDLQGDGLPDLVRSYKDLSGTTTAVYLNNGINSWSSTSWTVPTLFASSTGDPGTRIADVDGDGLSDLLQGLQATQRKVFTNRAEVEDLLISVTENSGGKTTIVYKGSSEYVASSGGAYNDALPFTMQTVQTITKNDSYGNVGTTTYSYSGGDFYYRNPTDKKFGGFEIISRTDPDGNVTKTFYHQGNSSNVAKGEYDDHIAKSGKPYRVEIYNGSTTLLSKTLSKWDRYDLGGNDRSFVKLIQTIDFSKQATSSSGSSAWVYEQKFNSLTDGDLNNQEFWSGDIDFDVQSATAYEGAKGVKASSINDSRTVTRNITAISDGSVYGALRRTSAASGNAYLSIDGVMPVRFGSDGNISAYNNDTASYEAITSYSANQWYVVNIEFDDNVQPDKFRARAYNGSWGAFSGWKTVYGGSYSTIDSILLSMDGPNGVDNYWDTITPTDPTASTTATSTIGVRASTFTYATSTGNITGKVDWGEVSADDYALFTDTGTDLASTSISYAASSTGSLTLPVQETVRDSSGTKVKETALYYDSNSATSSSISRGNVTRIAQWKSGTSYASTSKAYTPLGLVAEESDARGATTTYRYDTNQLYPASTTNPLGHAVSTYWDYSLGKPATTTDANGRNFATVYDGLDRVSQVKEPDPNAPASLLLKTVYTYTDSGSRNVKETQYLSSATSTEFYKYLDGFNRTVQERKQAEDANTYAVRDFDYNRRGLLEKESIPYFATGSATTSATSSVSAFTNYSMPTMGSGALPRPPISLAARPWRMTPGGQPRPTRYFMSGLSARMHLETSHESMR